MLFFLWKKSPKFQCHTIKTKKKTLDITIVVPELSWHKLSFLTLWKFWKNLLLFFVPKFYIKMGSARFQLSGLKCRRTLNFKNFETKSNWDTIIASSIINLGNLCLLFYISIVCCKISKLENSSAKVKVSNLINYWTICSQIWLGFRV